MYSVTRCNFFNQFSRLSIVFGFAEGRATATANKVFGAKAASWSFSWMRNRASFESADKL